MWMVVRRNMILANHIQMRLVPCIGGHANTTLLNIIHTMEPISEFKFSCVGLEDIQTIFQWLFEVSLIATGRSMKFFISLVVCFSASLAPTVPATGERAVAPTVDLPYATVVGSSSLGVDSSKRISFAQPPVLDLSQGIFGDANSRRGCYPFLEANINDQNL